MESARRVSVGCTWSENGYARLCFRLRLCLRLCLVLIAPLGLVLLHCYEGVDQSRRKQWAGHVGRRVIPPEGLSARHLHIGRVDAAWAVCAVVLVSSRRESEGGRHVAQHNDLPPRLGRREGVLRGGAG